MGNAHVKTDKMNNFKERLKNGEHIEFESENDMMTIHFDTMAIGGSQKFWWIKLNCKFIHSSKTFGSFDKKLTELIEKRDLKECESIL